VSRSNDVDVDVNATTRNKNVITDSGIERRPEQPRQPVTPAARENQRTCEPAPGAPTTHPAPTNPVK
jgi:hypothetical protein